MNARYGIHIPLSLPIQARVNPSLHTVVVILLKFSKLAGKWPLPHFHSVPSLSFRAYHPLTLPLQKVPVFCPGSQTTLFRLVGAWGGRELSLIGLFPPNTWAGQE